MEVLWTQTQKELAQLRVEYPKLGEFLTGHLQQLDKHYGEFRDPFADGGIVLVMDSAEDFDRITRYSRAIRLDENDLPTLEVAWAIAEEDETTWLLGMYLESNEFSVLVVVAEDTAPTKYIQWIEKYIPEDNDETMMEAMSKVVDAAVQWEVTGGMSTYEHNKLREVVREWIRKKETFKRPV